MWLIFIVLSSPPYEGTRPRRRLFYHMQLQCMRRTFPDLCLVSPPLQGCTEMPCSRILLGRIEGGETQT